MASREVWVQFHGLAAGGEAVGRDEAGKTVFAPFGAPGDMARVAIGHDKKSFSRGLIEQLETVSPLRTAPLCPQFRPHQPADSCGGCAWQHVTIAAQRQAKREIVAAALARLGHQEVEVEPCRGGADYAYRNKADFVVGSHPQGAQNEGHIGFFARESHDLVAAGVCPIQLPQNEDILRAANEILGARPHLSFDARTGRGALRRLVTRVSSQGQSLVTLVGAGGDWPAVARELRMRVPHLVGVLAREERGAVQTVWGQNFLTEQVNGLDFRVEGEGFWQVNPEMTPILAQTALEWAQIRPGQRALDLFCGAGLFALHFARAGAAVTGIEASRGACENARQSATDNGLPAQFLAGDAARELRRFGRGDFDLIVLDPPRAGAAECLETLVELAAPRLIYVSCDPATLARDAKTLGENGYSLRRAVPFDLFPQTAHVETIALFERI